jgi:hypothetical protein
MKWVDWYTLEGVLCSSSSMQVHGYILMFYIVYWCLENATFVRLNWLISCTILMRGDQKGRISVTADRVVHKIISI